jgi:hypothetical protein
MRSAGARASRYRIVGNELRSGGNPWPRGHLEDGNPLPPRALGRRFLWGFGLKVISVHFHTERIGGMNLDRFGISGLQPMCERSGTDAGAGPARPCRPRGPIPGTGCRDPVPRTATSRITQEFRKSSKSGLRAYVRRLCRHWDAGQRGVDRLQVRGGHRAGGLFGFDAAQSRLAERRRGGHAMAR